MTITVNQIRKTFLNYFEKNGHKIIPSSSLVPDNDPTLMFTNSGMVQFKNIFTGAETAPYKRATTSQKSVRAGGKHNDLDSVGYDVRHHTFFEMLGNFSFGDYFKEEAINYAWELVTKEFGLPKDRLAVTVFHTDEVSRNIWKKVSGLPEDRIIGIATKDNFWQMGDTGPCGYCSEIFYDHGPEVWGGLPGTPEEDGDRWIEIWNLVFDEFEDLPDGSRIPLKQKCIDTGMGLERIAAILQGVHSNFDIDLFRNLIKSIADIANSDPEGPLKASHNVIADHLRSAAFLIADGVLPSNEGRGYVLRRIIRRAARHGRLLGIDGKFLANLSTTVIEGSKDGYPELEEKKDFILNVLTQEEDKFNKTIDQGLAILTDLEEKMTAEGKTVMDGEDAFRLYDTYGFPIDLTKEILEEKGFSIDEDGFNAAMQKQREMARKARKATNYMGADATVYESLDPAITSSFVGYDKLEAVSRISALTTEDEVVEALTDGDKGTIIVDATPFYGTMGGQEGDKGVITSADGKFAVEDTIHLKGGKIGHVGYVVSGMFKLDDEVTLSVDKENRSATCKNHTATHLLQKALRDVLGTHVEQQGSLNNAGHLRFDFSHFSAMTAEELEQVEKAVNEKIAENIPVVTKLMTLDEAKKSGAMALFGEKYGDTVRVVCVDDYSKEFCGGTHVSNTGEIQAFKILSESGVAAGVRRIEALTGQGVFDYYNDLEKKLEEAAKTVKATPANLQEKLEHLMADLKSLQAENESLKSKAAKEALGDVMDQVQDVNGVKLLAVSVADVDMNGLRDLGDQLKEKLGEGVVVLASAKDGKVNLIAMATDAAMKQGAHAGNLIKGIAALVGGGGGGRPNMAQAGGKNPAGIDAAIAEAAKVLAGQIDK